MQTAYENIGLKPLDFWSLTWSEFYALCRNFENIVYDQYRPARILGSIFINLWSKKKVRPEDVICLPGDQSAKELTKPLMTKDRFEKLKTLWK
jgi:hypothetical protein